MILVHVRSKSFRNYMWIQTWINIFCFRNPLIICLADLRSVALILDNENLVISEDLFCYVEINMGAKPVYAPYTPPIRVFPDNWNFTDPLAQLGEKSQIYFISNVSIQTWHYMRVGWQASVGLKFTDFFYPTVFTFDIKMKGPWFPKNFFLLSRL